MMVLFIDSLVTWRQLQNSENGNSSYQRFKPDLHKALLFRLKVWHRPVPKTDETPLSGEWS